MKKVTNKKTYEYKRLDSVENIFLSKNIKLNYLCKYLFHTKFTKCNIILKISMISSIQKTFEYDIILFLYDKTFCGDFITK